MTLGVTDGNINSGMYKFSDGVYADMVEAFDTSLPQTGLSGTHYIGNSRAIGVTTDQTKSGIILNRTTTKYLNFFVN